MEHIFIVLPILFVLNIEMVFQNIHFFLERFFSIIDINFNRNLLDFVANGSPFLVLECWNWRIWLIESITTVITATCTISIIIIIIIKFLKRGILFYTWPRRAIFCHALIVATAIFRCKQIHKIWLIIWQPLTLRKDTVEISHNWFSDFTYFTGASFMGNVLFQLVCLCFFRKE